jgi:hypothetical protein
MCSQSAVWCAEAQSFHDAKLLGVFAEGGVQKSVRACVLIGISEGDLVAERILLEKTNGVTDADVEIHARQHSGAVEVRTCHDE